MSGKCIFIFSAKLPRLITHEKRLDPEQKVKSDLIRFLELLEPLSSTNKLGCILIQLPPSFTYDRDLENLKAFLEMIPEGYDFAAEFRDYSWMRNETWKVLEKNNIAYFIIKDIVGGGPLEPFMRDPYLEDIHIIAGEKIHLIHKIWGMIKTNVVIDGKKAPAFTRALSEKMGAPVSEGRPIVDGVLPDGSRGNIVYSSAVSIKGPSMTIRRFTETPISVTDLINWKTLSSPPWWSRI